ncbi:hypothetical protein [Aeromonas allosaccharophila]|uniref:hypothetical protein n=1 Tax=Aeromonas allosaccharophila TaxID=656 RepID=UPI003007C340
MNETITVDTYSMDSYTAGTNDQGEALYVLDGIEMTAAQAEEHKDHFMAEAEMDHADTQGADNDTLPETVMDGLFAINNVLGGEGAAEFYADELLGMGDDRMADVMSASGMSREEIQSHAEAVIIDMASHVGMPHDFLMNELQADINKVRASRSKAAMKEMHEVITAGIAGDYHSAMGRWDRLRGAMKAAKV